MATTINKSVITYDELFRETGVAREVGDVVTVWAESNAAVSTGGTGHLFGKATLNDAVQDQNQNGKIVRCGVVLFKGNNTTSENWSAGTPLTLTDFQVHIASPLSQSATDIASKGYWYSGGTVSTVVSVASLAAALGTAIAADDKFAVFATDVTNVSAAFTSANNITQVMSFLRFYAVITQTTGATANVNALFFAEIKRLRA